MTLDEKVAQLRSTRTAGPFLTGPGGRFSPDSAARHAPLGIGRVERPSEGPRGGRTAAEAVRYVNALQHFLVERTRLGVPALTHEEALQGDFRHGFWDTVGRPPGGMAAGDINVGSTPIRRVGECEPRTSPT